MISTHGTAPLRLRPTVAGETVATTGDASLAAQLRSGYILRRPSTPEWPKYANGPNLPPMASITPGPRS
jgi:hypothetical protein